MIRKKSQFNADLYLSSINIATETTPHSQSNDVSHVKRHYVMNPICGRYVLQSRQGQFSNFQILILALNSFRVVICFISLGTRFQIFGAM